MRTCDFKSEAFDKEVYAQNPERYLSKFRPGRVFEPAQPGPEVVPLEAVTGTFQKVLQGERVVLNVKATPGVPVSFYTPQNGEFENRLTSNTVAAGEDGIATATWFAGPGTMGLVDIMAASPVHSGQLAFRVQVSLPGGAGILPGQPTPASR